MKSWRRAMWVLPGVGLVALVALVVFARVHGPRPVEKEMTDSLGMKLVRIPAGEFQMGGQEPAENVVRAFSAHNRKAEEFKDEYPRHRVRITRPFFLGKYEVTVGQF